MTSALDTYQALETLTSEMLALVIKQDFDRVAELMPAYDDLSEKIKVEPIDKLDSEIVSRIKLILDNQQEIERRLSPWMSHVRTLLREGKQEQAVISAYSRTP